MLNTLTLGDLISIGRDCARYNIAFLKALERESIEFSNSCLIATQIAREAIKDNPLTCSQARDILIHNTSLSVKGLMATNEKSLSYWWDLSEQASSALWNSLYGGAGETFAQFVKREADVMEAVADFHMDIEEIEEEFGFKFNNTKAYTLVHESDSFLLYQVLPTREGVTVRDDLKPVLLVPPYMLGVHILAFLPKENKSYAHSFANEGIPTYVRVVKDIMEDESVQKMTPEADCLETLELLTVIKSRHNNQKVTLNGTCQGGHISLMNILSGKLTDVCDALITNVTPVDGSYSDAISGMPQMHSDFITTTLPNGNEVANGYLLSLGMRFVAIDRETPLIKVLEQAAIQRTTNLKPGKTVAALYRWLLKERVHLPIEISKMSSATFQKPISKDGTLPVKLFDQELNLKHLKDLGIKWYQNYAAKDDLVTPPCATAGNKFLDDTVLESVMFPGGHVAILTSPYNKRAPVNGKFLGVDGKEHRGPVAWQLEFNKWLNKYGSEVIS